MMLISDIPGVEALTQWKARQDLRLLQLTFDGDARKIFYRRLSNSLRVSTSPDGRETYARTPMVALRLLETNYSDGGLRPNAPMALFCRKIRWRLNAGMTLGRALKGFVPPGERAIIEAGTTSTRLGYALRACVLQIEKSQAIVKPVFSVFQAVLTLAILVYILVNFSTTVIPDLLSFIPLNTMSDTGRKFVAITQAIAAWWKPVVFGFIGIVAASFAALPYVTGPVRRILDELPIFSQYRIIVGGKVMVAFATLVEAGLTQKDALGKLGPILGPYAREPIATGLSGMGEGATFAQSLLDAKMYFPSKDILRDLASGAEGSDIIQAVTDWLDLTAQLMDKFFAGLNLALLAISSLTILGFNFAIMDIIMTFRKTMM